MNQKLIYGTLIFVLVLAAGKFVYVVLRQQPSVITPLTDQRPSQQNQPPARNSSAFAQSPTVKEETVWSSYRNEKYGFEFKYPQAWGEVEFEEASFDDQNLKRVKRLHKPDTGKRFIGNFSKNAGCKFGAITPDYTYPSEGSPFVSAGWVERNGRYYSLWPDSSIREFLSTARPEELFPNRIVTNGSGTVKALVFETRVEELDETDLTAKINLLGPVFRGMALGCVLGFYDAPEEISEAKSGFDLMLQTFGYVK